MAGWYQDRVAEIDGVIPMYEGDQPRSWFVYAPRLVEGTDRDEVIRRLEPHGVFAKPYLPCIHLQPYYREVHGHRPGELPVTEAISASTIALPFFPEMAEDQVDRVCDALAGVLADVSPQRPADAGRRPLRGARQNLYSGPMPSDDTTGARLWGGRFAGGPDEAFDRLNDSLPVDQRLWPQDLRGSRAHARMLGAQGVIPAADAEAILAGLDQVEDEMRSGRFVFRPGDEDIHTAVERRLTEIAGDAGRRVHTARSRNDQVITDVLLYVRETLEAQEHLLAQLVSALLDQAERHLDSILPGYTHLQRAQPVRLAHHLLAYVAMFDRDRTRLRVAWAACRDECPLGSGALSGVGFAVDRAAVAAELGFERPSSNSMDAVGSRDALADYLHFAAQLGVHLSRLGAEFVWWSSEECGFVEVADAFASGSSMLPQKKNPDAAELARAKAARLSADAAGLGGVLAGLPLAYNKDLQEDKHFLFDAVDTLDLLLPAVTGMVATAAFQPDRMDAATASGFLAATDLADHLVRGGTPFRRAHEIVGALVSACLAAGHGLEGATREQLTSAGLDPDDLPGLTAADSVELKQAPGGTGREPVTSALAAARARLATWS